MLFWFTLISNLFILVERLSWQIPHVQEMTEEKELLPNAMLFDRLCRYGFGRLSLKMHCSLGGTLVAALP